MANIVSDYSDGIPRISSCLLDARGNIVVERDSARVFYSASTIKLGVMIAAMQMVDAGELNLGQPMVSTQTFRSGVPGSGDYTFDPEEVDPGMAPLGETMDLLEVIRRMIVVSSNEATNMIAQLIGVSRVTEAFVSCGTRSTTMGRIFGDYAALNAGLSIETTAYDLAKTMHAVISGQAAGPQSTKIMVEILQEQEFPQIGTAVSQVRPDFSWGSKSGGVTGISHDVAFFHPRGQVQKAHSLAVCTRAYTREQGNEAIEAAASMILQTREFTG